MKYKIKGRVYSFIADLKNEDNEIISYKKLIENGQKEKFILVHSCYTNSFHLYTPSGKRILDFLKLCEV